MNLVWHPISASYPGWKVHGPTGSAEQSSTRLRELVAASRQTLHFRANPRKPERAETWRRRFGCGLAVGKESEVSRRGESAISVCRPTLAAFITLLALSSAAQAVVGTPELPPRNPFLADSSYPLGHSGSAQQDSVPMAGPSGRTRALAQYEIDYAPIGPAHFGAYTSGP